MIVSAFSDLTAMVENLSHQEERSVSTANYKRLNENMSANDKTNLANWSIPDLKKALAHFSRNFEHAISDIDTTKDSRGRPQASAEYSGIEHLLRTFEEGTGKKVTTTKNPDSGEFGGDAINFCGEVAKQAQLKAFTNSLIGTTSAYFSKSPR